MITNPWSHHVLGRAFRHIRKVNLEKIIKMKKLLSKTALSNIPWGMVLYGEEEFVMIKKMFATFIQK